jgi:hypothetical protein
VEGGGEDGTNTGIGVTAGTFRGIGLAMETGWILMGGGGGGLVGSV